LLALLPASPAGAIAEGDLDRSFDTDGQVSTPIGPGDDAPNAVALQRDGKIVVAGYATFANKDIEVGRYRPNGALDPNFGSGGLVGTAIGPGDEAANAIAIQPDGKIVVAGYAFNDGGNEDIAVVRYLPNGSPDSGFGVGGVATFGIGAGTDIGNAIAIQPDGKIVVAGYFFNGLNDDMAVVRFTRKGAIDTMFGAGGFQTTTGQLGSNHDRANGVAVQPDGRIVLAGFTTYANDDTTLVRYTKAGALDSGFGVGGIKDVDAGRDDRANAIRILPGGKIMTAGFNHQSIPGQEPDDPPTLVETSDLLRFRADGTPDPGFGVDGMWQHDPSFGSGGASDLVLQPDGKILIAHSSFGPIVERVNAGGTLDPTFDPFASVFVSHLGSALAIQRDGRALVTGMTSNGEFGISRFIVDRTAPWGARVIGVARYSLASTRTVYWTASDVGTGVASFDVQRRQAASSAGTFGPWSAFRSKTPFTAAAFTGSPGFTYCFRARGRDFAKNVGPYSPAACEAIPLDERAMTASGSWSTLSNSDFYRGTAMSSTSEGAKLTVPATYRHLAVVVTTCPGCGTLRVSRGSTLLKSVSLQSASSHHERVIELASSRAPRSGVIKLTQASNGKKVIVEGLAVSLA
jgi:uncharacterized delta-60 repeat protein